MTATDAATSVRPTVWRRYFKGKVVGYLFVAALAYLLLLPIIELQRQAFANGAAGFRTAFGVNGFGLIIWTTVKLALGATAIGMVLGTGLALAADRLPRRLRFLQVLPILPIILPPVATTIGWMFLLAPRTGYVNTWLRGLPWWDHLSSGPIDIYEFKWITFISGLGLSAFVFIFVTAGLRNISGDLEEAARMNGASDFRVLTRVTLPLLRPVFAYAFGVVFLLGLGQFTAPLLLGRQVGVDVLSTEVYRHVIASPTDYGAAAAAGTPLLIFGLVMVLLQRRFVGDQGRFVTHGGKSAFSGQGRSAWWSPVIVVGYGLAALLLPLLALINSALSPYWSGKVEPGKYQLDGMKEALSDPRLTSAVRNSVTISITAVLIALPIGFLAATLLTRRDKNRVVRLLVDVMVGIPLVVPATVLGVGFLMTYVQKPFVLYGSPWVVILVYVALMVPFTTRMQMAGLTSLGEQYREAATVSGAGVLRTNLRIILPLMRPAVGGAAALMFILLSHEFSASLLVRTRDTQVMGTILYDFFTNGSYTWVATMSLVMACVTLVGLTVSFLIGGRRVLDRL